MTTETLFTNLAISLAASREVEEIARPLKEHFGVTSLVYGKNYNDGSEIRLYQSTCMGSALLQKFTIPKQWF